MQVTSGVNELFLVGISPAAGLSTGNGYVDLDPGTYSLLVLDEYYTCTFAFEYEDIEIEDGSMELENIVVEDIQLCSSTTGIASGAINGSFQADVEGGSGSFTISYSPDEGTHVPGVSDVNAFGIDSDGTYGVTITDNVHGCSISESFEIDEENLAVEMTDSDEVPVQMNDYYALEYGELSIETSVDVTYAGFLSYEWYPENGVDLTPGTYSSIWAPGDYEVTIEVGASGDCEATFELELTGEFYCDWNGDVNGDGIVNTGDQTLLLGQYGIYCSGSAGPPNCSTDLNADGITNSADLIILNSYFNTSEDTYCD